MWFLWQEYNQSGERVLLGWTCQGLKQKEMRLIAETHLSPLINVVIFSVNVSFCNLFHDIYWIVAILF